MDIKDRMRTLIAECRKGNHETKEFLRFSIESNVDAVIRHCLTCGAVVADTETDGRVRPGGIAPMRGTRLLRAAIETVDT